MKRASRRTRADDLARIDCAIAKLREARDLLREAGAVKATAYVRGALKSAEGARRHAESLLTASLRARRG
jgi:hypothetical protein